MQTILASLPWGSVDWNWCILVILTIKPGRSREGAWIEIRYDGTFLRSDLSRSREGAWIEILNWLIVRLVAVSLPWGSVDWNGNARWYYLKEQRRSREGAWIEIITNILKALKTDSRSREGAWIEISTSCSVYIWMKSLPWGSVDWNNKSPAYTHQTSRSLPWGSVDWNIFAKNRLQDPKGRSREGAWIEIVKLVAKVSREKVAPVRERGLKWFCRSEHSLCW